MNVIKNYIKCNKIFRKYAFIDCILVSVATAPLNCQLLTGGRSIERPYLILTYG